MLSNGELCAYCGRAEHALCSSMVVGQTKAEAEWFIKNFMVKSSPANICSCLFLICHLSIQRMHVV